MVDWKCLRAERPVLGLEVLRTNFGPDETNTGIPSVYGLGLLTSDGKHKIMLANKPDHRGVDTWPLRRRSGVVDGADGLSAAPPQLDSGETS